MLRLPLFLGRTAPALGVAALLAGGGCATFGAPAMSLQEERRLGQEARAEVEQSLQVSRDPVAVNYIRGIGERLVEANDLRDFDYTFDVVESPQVNAFAVPGGHLYVNTGLICTAATEDELAGVIGHEIGHAAERHAVSQMSAQQQTQAVALGGAALLSILLGGEPGQVSPAVAIPATLAARGYLLKYSRDQERESDDLAVRYLHRAGYDPRALPSFFEKLKAQEPGSPSRLAALLSSHPVTGDRIEATRRAAAEIGPPPSRPGDGEDAELRGVKAHLDCDRLLAEGRRDQAPSVERTPRLR